MTGHSHFSRAVPFWRSSPNTAPDCCAGAHAPRQCEGCLQMHRGPIAACMTMLTYKESTDASTTDAGGGKPPSKPSDMRPAVLAMLLMPSSGTPTVCWTTQQVYDTNTKESLGSSPNHALYAAATYHSTGRRSPHRVCESLAGLTYIRPPLQATQRQQQPPFAPGRRLTALRAAGCSACRLQQPLLQGPP